MEQRIVREVIKVDGMSCASCEMRIENVLSRTRGVIEVKAVFSNSNVSVTYDADIIGPEQIINAIEGLDYKVRNKTAGEKGMPRNQLFGILIIILALYVIVKNTIGFRFIPEINQSMGYGLLFIVGLLTSIHCVAMCGGINLSQCLSGARAPQGSASDGNTPQGSAPQGSASDGNTPQGSASDSGAPEGNTSHASLKPSVLYNSGRVVSYTLLGGIVGALGSAVSFSGAAKGIVTVISGSFMVIIGLNMLNIFPGLRKIELRMPRIFGKKIYNNNGKYGPFFIGLLNGLMPCGPLQSMQLYALGTGSFAAGALSMLMFSLGTVPLMFGLGALSSVIAGQFRNRMLKFSAALVIILGVIMANRGLMLSGINIIPGFNSTSGAGTTSEGRPSAAENVARIEGGIQLVTTELESGRYTPIVVQKGIPLRWTIKADRSDLNGCNNPLTIPQYDMEVKLKVGENIIEFTPESEGNIVYTCWMGMINSNIKVVSDLAAVAEE